MQTGVQRSSDKTRKHDICKAPHDVPTQKEVQSYSICFSNRGHPPISIAWNRNTLVKKQSQEGEKRRERMSHTVTPRTPTLIQTTSLGKDLVASIGS